MDQNKLDAIQAQAFRGLIAHLQNRTDAQNIDIMNLAGFCRNCLSKWILAASNELDGGLDYDQALEMVYDMPYANWKQKYQEKASDEQIETFEKTKPLHAKISGHR
ncbi:MAG: DUF1244 domain-containing protein [Proteobacteria bacterium]|nr:DUF1244 domain-containing protein [Pseudomonadota bacterium]